MIKALGPVLVAILAIIVSFIGSFLLLRTQREQMRLQNEFNERKFELEKSKEEREEIIKKLSSFYGPLKELRKQSTILYSTLSWTRQRENGQLAEKRSRTLRILIENHELSLQDTEILDQILQINQKLLELIISQKGVVDKPSLQELLGEFGAHIRLLQLAKDRKLTGPPELFDNKVFPLAIDGAIESAMLRLQERHKQLEEHLGRVRVNQSTCDSIARWYDLNAEAYSQRTLYLDLSEFYQKFANRELLPVGGRILDAGCGAGRDTRHFIEEGYIVVAFDVSQEMVRMCQEYPHAYCNQQSFSELDYHEEFDGVWACASLLHLRVGQAKLAMRRLVNALKPGGVMFVSVKKGHGEATFNGRYYQYYDETTIHKLFDEDVRVELLPGSPWSSKSVETDDSDSGEWVNVVLRRKPRR